MRKGLVTIISLVFTIFIIFVFKNFIINSQQVSGAPPYGASEDSTPNINFLSWLAHWERPEGPTKVALQVGHWNNEELPEELKKLRGNSGSSGGGKSEWEVNLVIAQEVASILKEEGIEVEILPATIPPLYWADVFISIHADGSIDTSKRGFKIASPWRDYTGKASNLVRILETSYGETIGWEKDPNISRNMRGYYAFSWWRYEHALHPMTTAAIIETGFLTNASDRRILIESPEIASRAIATGLLTFLEREGLLES